MLESNTVYEDLNDKEKTIFDRYHRDTLAILNQIKEDPDTYHSSSDSRYYEVLESEYEEDYKKLLKGLMYPIDFIFKYWIGASKELKNLNIEYYDCRRDKDLIEDFINKWKSSDKVYEYTLKEAKEVFDEAKKAIYSDIIDEFVSKTESIK